MHYAPVRGPELHSPDVALLSEPCRNNKTLINVVTVGRHVEGTGHGEDQIGLSEPPAIGKMRRWGELRWIAFRCAFGSPFLDQRDLSIGEAALADEFAESVDRLPRRHESADCNRRDQFRALGSVLIGHQREWRDFPLMMAARAMVVEDGSDIATESDGRGADRRHR